MFFEILDVLNLFLIGFILSITGETINSCYADSLCTLDDTILRCIFALFKTNSELRVDNGSLLINYDEPLTLQTFIYQKKSLFLRIKYVIGNSFQSKFLCFIFSRLVIKSN